MRAVVIYSFYKSAIRLCTKSWRIKWRTNGILRGNAPLVVGATFPNEIKEVREIVGDMPPLIPGIGAQGGGFGRHHGGRTTANGTGVMINSSRADIFHASAGEDLPCRHASGTRYPTSD